MQSFIQGHKHFTGLEEVILKNINACKEISAKIKRSLGPFGKLTVPAKDSMRPSECSIIFRGFRKAS